MGYRDFRDESGTDWRAWDVMPQLFERRVASRRTPTAPYASQLRSPAGDGEAMPPAERRGADRRITASSRPSLRDGMSRGWLCFESAAGKRRLTPIPQDWLDCAVPQLLDYCSQAQPVLETGPRPRMARPVKGDIAG